MTFDQYQRSTLTLVTHNPANFLSHYSITDRSLQEREQAAIEVTLQQLETGAIPPPWKRKVQATRAKG